MEENLSSVGAVWGLVPIIFSFPVQAPLSSDSFSQSNWILKLFSGFSKDTLLPGGMAEIRTDLSLILPNLDFFHNIVTSVRKSLAEKPYCASRLCNYFFMNLFKVMFLKTSSEELLDSKIKYFSLDIA